VAVGEAGKSPDVIDPVEGLSTVITNRDGENGGVIEAV